MQPETKNLIRSILVCLIGTLIVVAVSMSLERLKEFNDRYTTLTQKYWRFY